MFKDAYPYTDFHELNLDWIISQVQQFNTKLDTFININKIKYADPIQWDISTQYEANTIVINEYNTYLSKLPVPRGIAIDNDVYWLLIGNFNTPLEELKERVTNVEIKDASQDVDIAALYNIDAHAYNNSTTYSAGQYVIYNKALYRKIGATESGIVPTTSGHWVLCNVGDEIMNVNSTLTNNFGNAKIKSGTIGAGETINIQCLFSFVICFSGDTVYNVSICRSDYVKAISSSGSGYSIERTSGNTVTTIKSNLNWASNYMVFYF